MNYELCKVALPPVIAGLTRNPLIKRTAAEQGIPRQARDDKKRKNVSHNSQLIHNS
jgi:hypothetical protein